MIVNEHGDKGVLCKNYKIYISVCSFAIDFLNDYSYHERDDKITILQIEERPEGSGKHKKTFFYDEWLTAEGMQERVFSSFLVKRHKACHCHVESMERYLCFK